MLVIVSFMLSGALLDCYFCILTKLLDYSPGLNFACLTAIDLDLFGPPLPVYVFLCSLDLTLVSLVRILDFVLALI